MTRKNGLLNLILSLTLSFGMAQSSAAQTAKYNRAGDLVSITNLLPDVSGCEAPKVFTGKIIKADSFDSNNVVGFEFLLRLAAGKAEKLQAAISLDEGALIVDFENLMQKNRQLRIKARRCGSGGFWTAEEIKRL